MTYFSSDSKKEVPLLLWKQSAILSSFLFYHSGACPGENHNIYNGAVFHAAPSSFYFACVLFFILTTTIDISTGILITMTQNIQSETAFVVSVSL